MKKTILFVTYGGGHVNMLLPLIKEFKKKTLYEVSVLALTSAGRILQLNNIPHLGFKDFLTDMDEDALTWGESMLLDLGLSTLVDKQESIAYLGLSYKDLVQRHGEIYAAQAYKEKSRSAFFPITILERVFSIIRPDLLVSTNSPRAEKAAFITANKLNIPAVCLMDLFDKREIDDRLGKSKYASKICVFSDTVKKLLIQAGRNAKDIVVTGNPDFDVLAGENLKKQAQLFSLKKKLPDSKVVFWARHAGKANFNLNASIDDEVIRIAKNNKDLFFIIRPHPNEPKMFSDLPDNVLISNKEDNVHEVILCSNLVLTIASTVGLQAVCCGIPLITFDMGPTSMFTPYSKMGLSIGVNSLDQLESEINAIFKNGYHKKVFVPKAGNATKNVINVINEYL